MSELLPLLVGALLFGAGWLAGKRSQPRADPYVCGCGHPLALHDPNAGECHGMAVRLHYDEWNEVGGQESVPCTCRQYIVGRPPSRVKQ